MKSVIALLVVVIGSSSAFASETSKSEQAYLDCIDYGHRPVSAEKDKACREAAAKETAQEDDYDQAGFPAPPIPDGEIAIESLKEITLTEEAVFTAYVEKSDRKATVYGLGDTNAVVKCNLTASQADISKFDVIKKEYPGGTGARVYITPKKSITLKYKTSLQGVEEQAPWCNGEPEFCENGQSTYVYRTQIFATDKKGNTWSLNCVAPFSRTVYASDVKINGIRIK